MVKNPPASAGGKGDAGLLFGSGRSPRGGNSNPLHYACLGNPMDRSLAGYSLRGHKELDTTEHNQVITKLIIISSISKKLSCF